MCYYDVESNFIYLYSFIHFFYQKFLVKFKIIPRKRKILNVKIYSKLGQVSHAISSVEGDDLDERKGKQINIFITIMLK